jgi:hypothetical protein
LEQALIQLWQPRLNTPFIYQFFNCREGLITRSKFSNSRQFGTFSLWQKLRWTSTPQHVRRALHSPLSIAKSLAAMRFHMEKKIRSNEFGPQGCYFIRRLAKKLVKLKDHAPSTQLTEPSNFGRQNQCDDLFPFMHYSYFHQLGNET